VLGIRKRLGRLGIHRFVCKVSVLFLLHITWRLEERFHTGMTRFLNKIKVNFSSEMVLRNRTLNVSSHSPFLLCLNPLSNTHYPDGPLGVRYVQGATAFSAGIHAASTWDISLIRERGSFLGAEAKALGIHVQLGPSAGPLGKFANGGRNWEVCLLNRENKQVGNSHTHFLGLRVRSVSTGYYDGAYD
jgi:hypothetical protein